MVKLFIYIQIYIFGFIFSSANKHWCILLIFVLSRCHIISGGVKRNTSLPPLLYMFLLVYDSLLLFVLRKDRIVYLLVDRVIERERGAEHSQIPYLDSCIVFAFRAQRIVSYRLSLSISEALPINSGISLTNTHTHTQTQRQ